MDYRNNINPRYWGSILQRKLTEDEYEILHDVKSEIKMNSVINDIHNKVIQEGLYFPMLTENDGNCLFHSLCYYNLAKDIVSLKKSISNMMIFFKDKKNFIPNQDLTLAELFSFHNEIQNVFCYKKHKMYKYNYDTMCIDILADDGWKRINTELMLTVLSIVLNIKFKIYHNNNHITNICPVENEDTQIIILAQLGECHYIPLDVIPKGKKVDCPMYTENYKKFLNWADSIMNDDYESNSENNLDDHYETI
jgi:hypothetical protein